MTARGATKGAYVIGAIGAALYLAARTTGAGWLIVILCGVAAVLVVGAVWPRIALARVRIEASAPPTPPLGRPPRSRSPFATSGWASVCAPSSRPARPPRPSAAIRRRSA